MTTTPGTQITTPPSRIVWGNPGKQRQRTDNNNKPIIKADGTPALQYIFGLAIPKPEFGPIWAAMSGEAAKGYPSGAPQNFAWKMDDGDDTRPVNGGGVPYAQREGYPGCYVLTIASALDNPPPLYKFNPQTGAYDQIPIDTLKTGDFVTCALNIVCNVPEQRTHTPSLYLNPQGLEFIGHGKEIQSVNAIDPKAAFGGRQHQLPPGASATPISSAPAGATMPGAYQPQQQPGAPAPMPAYAPPAYQQPMQPAPAPQYQQPQPGGYQAPQMPPPAHDFVQPGAPQQMPAYAPPAGPGGYQQPMQPAPAPQYQQPMPGAPAPMQQPGGYQPQPMPGHMPPR